MKNEYALTPIFSGVTEIQITIWVEEAKNFHLEISWNLTTHGMETPGSCMVIATSPAQCLTFKILYP